MTSITHTGCPVALSLACTNRSPLDASKSRLGSNPPAAYAPCANTWPNSTGIGPSNAIANSCLPEDIDMFYQVKSD